MELTIRPDPHNRFPLAALLIEGPRVADWLREVRQLGLPLATTPLYPVPGPVPNSVWGCLVVPAQPLDARRAGRHQLCQRVFANLYIPERAALYPAATEAEIGQLLSARPHLMHPAVGLAELPEPLDVGALLAPPPAQPVAVVAPAPPTFVPNQVKSFQVQAVSDEEVLRNLEASVVPAKEPFPDPPLSWFEKLKLLFYRLFLNKPGSAPGQKAPVPLKEQPAQADQPSANPGWLARLRQRLTSGQWLQDLGQDYENLDQRNQQQVDKLLRMLQNDPARGLQYAIPLDEGGSSRGGSGGQFTLAPRWLDFSLFGQLTGGKAGGGAADIGDQYYRLQQQYRATAEELLKRQDHQKAAFVYLKLLKDNRAAADALEQGRYYQEAATVYLRHANDKPKAAACYEKGHLTTQAIDLYKELNQDEKVGDLYAGLGKRREANVYFDKVADQYAANHQYVKAAVVYRDKMDAATRGQALLREGWRTNRDATNCLSHYFGNIPDPKRLEQEIQEVYRTEVEAPNREAFLRVISHQYARHSELAEPLREMAYEIVAAQVGTNPAVVAELKAFNPDNTQLLKDTIRFKLSLNKRKA